MEFTSFEDIITFAIEKEKEAAAFYEEASEQESYSGAKKTFQEFAQEERKHQAMFEGFLRGDAKLPDYDLRIRGVPRRLEEVFDNLLSNALKFSPDGGEIKVQAQMKNGAVEVSVADQGIGVPIEEQERIFERFYQVDSTTTRRFEGTGLGLSIVKQIIEGHGGQVWVASPTLNDASGRGSTFYFTVPKI